MESSLGRQALQIETCEAMARHTRNLTVADMNPRTALMLHRNHFETGEDSLCGRSRDSIGNRVVGTAANTNGLTAALWASQRQTAYRFGWVNACFNPRKVLIGDDPDAAKRHDGQERDWL